MSVYGKPNKPEPTEGFATGMLACFAVLGTDILAGVLALMSGDMAAGAVLLLLYMAAVLGLGLYWYYYRNLIARLIGMGLGLLPIVLLLLAAASV